jgi:hypothetical protein
MPSSGMLRRMAFVRTDVSEELSASFSRVARIGELGTTLAVREFPSGVSEQKRLDTLAHYVLETDLSTSLTQGVMTRWSQRTTKHTLDIYGAL